jgi:hypothetical protein
MTSLGIIFLSAMGIALLCCTVGLIANCEQISKVCCIIGGICAVVMLVTLIWASATHDGVTEFDFPKKEYKLTERIVTQDKVSDTTYVLIKLTNE